jgi:hypothetical protein
LKIKTALLAAFVAFSTPAFSQEAPWEFFSKPETQMTAVWHGSSRRAERQETITFRGAAPQGTVQSAIARAAANTIGSHWTPTLLRIAKIESGFRCSPGGNGGGLFQFSSPTRWGISRHAAKQCGPNISAAMRYAAHCIAQGARNSAQMMACWNGGSPHVRRNKLERAYRIALG